MRTSIAACVAITMMLASATVGAHHAPVMFDRATKVDTGRHRRRVCLDEPARVDSARRADCRRRSRRWGVEIGSPNSMVRNGWKSNIIKAGDTVTVTVNPLKSGEHGGTFVSIKLPDGRVLGGRQTD